MAASGRVHRRLRPQGSRTRRYAPVVAVAVPLLFLTVCSLRKGRSAAAANGLLWMTPRTGGFNNQLITVYQAIRCAQTHRRTVVLPLIYENVRADTSSKGTGPYPFEDYFDIEALRQIVPVTTPRELDETGLPCSTIFFATSKHFKATERRIPRLLKQQYTKRYPVNLTFVESISAHRGEVCMDDSFCDIPSEFGVYSDYKETGQGFSIRRSPVLRAIRAAFKPSPVVQKIADIALKGIGGPFNAMHVRRGDFGTKCEELPLVCEEYGNNSFVQSPEWILQKASNFPNPHLPLFLSTTHPDECRELFSGRDVKLIFMDDFQVPSEFSWAVERTDIISFASQLVVSRADGFVGNRFSSYTTEINNMRFLRNRNDRLTFF